MAIRTHVCFAAGKALTEAESRYFGTEIAEIPIIIDYLDATLGSIFGQKERDWWDEGPLSERTANYLSVLDRRHRLSANKRAALRREPIPDILTYSGLDAAQIRAATPLSRDARKRMRLPNLMRLIPKQGPRHEFYE